jgi:N-formylglutamate amidohydrolase
VTLPGWVVRHIPHTATAVPDSVRVQFVVGDAVLARELGVLTDHHAQELFGDAGGESAAVLAEASRLVVDVERFADDAREPASQKGFGVIYTRTTAGGRLRRLLTDAERTELLERHAAHHRRVADAVAAAVAQHGRCLILDGHTFPDQPLPFAPVRPGEALPDVCLGADPQHTPGELVRYLELGFREQGWTVAVNRPFAGALVPEPMWRRDPRVTAVLVDVNRRLLGADATTSAVAAVARRVQDVVAAAVARMAAVPLAAPAVAPPRDEETPRVFEVCDGGDLRLAGFEDPRTRAECFEEELDGWFESPAAMADIAERFWPLDTAVYWLCAEEREALAKRIAELEAEVDAEDGEPRSVPVAKEQLRDLRRALDAMPQSDPDAARDWLRSLDAATFRARVVPYMTRWSAERPDGEEVDAASIEVTGRGIAFGCFEGMDYDDCEKLGVEVIDGDRPGSSDFAAELRGDIGAANRAAREADLAVRFVPADTVVGLPGRAAKSVIPAATVAAYRETHFRVEATPPFVLRIGEPNPHLAELCTRWGVTASAFVTACNPHSESRTEADNAARHAALRDELVRRGLPFVEGAGRHPDNGWPPEASFLVLGLELDEAR